MPESYGLTTETITVVDLFADDHPPVLMPATIVSGSGKLTKGRVLGRITATSKFKPYLFSNSDGSEVARVILSRDIDATSEDVNVPVFVHGAFNKNALTGIDATAILKLQEFGLYIKEVK